MPSAASTATALWTFTPASTGVTCFNTPFVHGLGVGDVDGDTLPDILERSGWWRQTSRPGGWERRAFDFGMGLPVQPAQQLGRRANARF